MRLIRPSSSYAISSSSWWPSCRQPSRIRGMKLGSTGV